ncbi:hypothetical protein [Pararhodobacter zhoushanensis]|uniref:hypothetical protein n=1 Tax=Pararhodobacter zhoushanensis TaxID=2479545 RepID=UPI0015F2C6C1|nr:hypothetical protein [Pararhodobacter zhoushanensis]
MSRPDLPPARAQIRRLPFTLGFLAVMLVANALAGTFAGRIDPEVLAARGIGVAALGDGDLTRFLTATFLSHDLPMLLRQLPFAALVIGAAEWRWGSARTAGLFFGIDLAATLILLAVVALVPALGALEGVTDVGMSLGGFGLIGVWIATRRRAGIMLAAILAAIVVKFSLAPEALADAGHVFALVIGFGIGLYGAQALGPAAGPAGVGPPTRPESARQWGGRQ